MVKTKRNICILSHGLESGGIGTFVANVVKTINLKKYNVVLVLALDQMGSHQFREDEVLAQGVRVLRTNDLNGIKKKLLHFIRVYKILKENSYDVFHANMDMLNGLNLLVALLARVPVRICHAHTIASTYEANHGKRWFVRVYRRLMRFLIWNCSTHRCGCSEPAMNYLYEDRWKKDKNSKIIFNGIDLDAFHSVHRDNTRVKYRIVTVGRITEVKNPFFTVEVMQKLCKMRKDCELIWVGTGDLENAVKENIHSNGLSKCVQMLGARHDVNEILKTCDLFLLPSLFEGLGIVLIEAQAAGLPCIASDTVPTAANCGGIVYLSLSESAERWVQKISDILDKKIVLQIEPERLAKYDLTYMAKQLEEVYG